MSWDAAKHFRGYHGRFAGGVDRSEIGVTPAPAAYHGRISESAARKRKLTLNASATEVHRAFILRDMNGGRSNWKDAAITEYQGRAGVRAMRETGTVKKTIRQGFRDHVGSQRNVDRAGSGRATRTRLKTTFTGKKAVVREWGGSPRFTHASKRSARQMMSNPKPEYVGRRRATD